MTAVESATPLQLEEQAAHAARQARLFGRPVVPPPVERKVEVYRPPTQLFEIGSLPLSNWKRIMIEVAEKHGVSPRDLVSSSRFRNIAAARFEAFYRVYLETNMGLPEIGRKFGGRDHTTVLHGIRTHAERIGDWVVATQKNFKRARNAEDASAAVSTV